ncbi:NAD(P)/FAD-dependent oxidoreductase [Luedemannella helvata]|uniref:NAD(P)/FAD-dependent oxidoreductase n=1 Tax=Luedemannella helvata TaxID=349315 RepID=A0ABP4VVS1_9ACTN
MIDKDALKLKYAEERAKRLRPDGPLQYRKWTGDETDPFTPRVERAPRRDHVTVAFIGGGLGGLVTGARLKEAGVDDVRLIEQGGDFGGAWYWNRYPGAQCDTASFVYLPLLEETGYMPTEKYAHGPEILEHCQRIGKHYGLYDNALFHTKVTDLEWDQARSRWIVRTDRGDEFTAQFVCLGTGPLHVPKLPGIPGIETFGGHSFHTSRWDYAYTGGDPLGAPMDKLADKRVAIVGTGATAVQCVPRLAEAARELFVFQRTPSSVDVRNNQPTDPEWFASIATPGWQQRWLENFTANQSGSAREDLVMDAWSDLARRARDHIRKLSRAQLTREGISEAYENADFEKMEEIRARVDAVVEDPETARRLKAWYKQLCKRPCFSDEYLQSFNRPNTHLVDTDGRGVTRITERGLVVGEVEYPVDCVIYASGFEVSTPFTDRSGFDLTGRTTTLARYWEEGMRTLHGIHVHGFPNVFVVQPSHGARLIANIPHNLLESGTTIAQIVKHALDHGYAEVEVTKQAEDAWMDLLLGSTSNVGAPDCTPGSYNNEGQDTGPRRSFFVGHPQGAQVFFRYIKEWRSSGAFEGLEFRAGAQP